MVSIFIELSFLQWWSCFHGHHHSDPAADWVGC